ncbi:hypothetical protein B9Z65_4001 [Elsinoe australis]|uniref:Enoyl reductase (ER) domain-containing protein n=1 Tax=Elsinoe australis TaxID=40998 RepID=A0A2P7Z1J7_9PEZI|nr:hypothetical protein B9Z65_4001 [Elsinoe australis]
MTPSVKQWVTSLDGLENLRTSEAPMPTPGENEVLVEIHAVSLNYRDTEVIMGLYNHHATTTKPEPLVPCSDMVGTIISLGPTTTAPPLPIGTRVLSTFNQSHLSGQIRAPDMATGLGLPLPGVLATHRVFPATGLVRCPSYLSDGEACTLPIAAVTAWMSLNGMRPMGRPGGRGERVLVQGTGGVAIAGLQIAVASGAEVAVISSSDGKLERVQGMGAGLGVNYRKEEKWEDRVMEWTGGEGVDVILEGGGAKTLRKSFDCVAFGGLIDCIGYLSGKEDEAGDRLNTNVLALRRNVTLKGILNGPRDRFEEMLGFYEEKEIRPVVDRVFAFGEAKEALQYLFSGGHFGKVVVRVAE